MIDLQNESVIQFSKIPEWSEEFLGRSMNRSTPHRWRTRGIRGIKLETMLVGGSRYTSYEALERFFAKTTAKQDE